MNYRRERELGEIPATGTEGMIDTAVREKYTAQQKEAHRYAERMHATLGEKSTVRKILSIRNQLGNI